MQPIDNQKNVFSSDHHDREHAFSLEKLLVSEKWVEYFQELAKTLNCELSVYNEGGDQLLRTNENSICQFIKSSKLDRIGCPSSCVRFQDLHEPVIFKCNVKMICFALPIERFHEKAFIIGRGGFASYDDFLEFLKIAKDHDISGLPISMPLHFPGEQYIKAISQFVYLTINRQLNGIEEKHRLEERLARMTALFDSQAFGTLSKSPDMMNRYILDTIEFVFGKLTAAFMVLDKTGSLYQTVYSIGTYKDAIIDSYLDAGHPVLHEMLGTRSAVFIEDVEKTLTEYKGKEIKSAHFFPIVVGDVIEGIIGIFDRPFSREEMRILNAFRDYVQLNLENQNLREEVIKNKKADERLTYLMDLSSSIVSILDKERLINMFLEKSLQLLSAEQGSLMLLDQDTSELVVEAKKNVDDVVQEKMRFKKEEGISGMVLERGDSFLVKDIEKDPRIKQLNRPRYRTKSFISIPIKIDDRLTGILHISDKRRGEAFSEDDVSLIESFVNGVAIAIERSILYKQTENLQKLSITDPLTGIYNRRYLNRRLSEEITRYNRYKHPFSFMMLDLDKFKEYNDAFGHIAGDNLIRTLAKIMEKSLRTIDIASRFGGDEFVAIFPQTPKVDAIQITNRLKEKIDLAISEEKIEMPLSVSIGLATFPDDASSIMELIEKTDQALYLAKKGGGNKVVYL